MGLNRPLDHTRVAKSRETLSTLIDEGLLEVEDPRLQMQDRPQSLPLAVTAELLRTVLYGNGLLPCLRS
ncbi:hypothetical protein FJTKL_03253 [Diaporthe vaccinii]|uniref:Uncharacterized protein n=1 Tax=Diaporthe vaccinii TaxID=105482 RepID=A0ABR4DVK2_9PEZI